jgi:hypothetical protein
MPSRPSSGLVVSAAVGQVDDDRPQPGRPDGERDRQQDRVVALTAQHP